MEKHQTQRRIQLMNGNTGNMEDYVHIEDARNNGTYDQKMICREIYNQHKETVYFHDMIHTHRPPIECKSGGWCFLPHGYFIPKCKSNSQEIKCIVNYGNMMFKGNKLPSRPEVKKG